VAVVQPTSPKIANLSIAFHGTSLAATVPTDFSMNEASIGGSNVLTPV
jgi:hypothetical protein